MSQSIARESTHLRRLSRLVWLRPRFRVVAKAASISAMAARRNAAVAKQLRARRLARVGAPPGLLTATSESTTTRIRVVAYDSERIEEHDDVDLDRLAALLSQDLRLWIDVDGLGDLELLRGLARLIELHPLALEDVMSPSERSKVERFRLHHFIVIRMPSASGPEDGERLSLFMGRNYVLTFQGERPGDCLDAVRERLRRGFGRVRDAGADYLAYALVDAVVDHYFPHAEALSSMIDALEEEVLGTTTPGLSERIHAAKRQARALKRSMASVRESVLTLQREPSEFICEETRLYLRDCLDHAIEIGERADSLREQAQGLMDLHLSMMSARMNDVMRVLAVVTTVFTPMTFLAGVYGMNFDPGYSPYNMPELRATYGYPLVLTTMAVIAISLLTFFGRRGWLTVGGDLRRADESWYTKFLQPLTMLVATSRSEAESAEDYEHRASATNAGSSIVGEHGAAISTVEGSMSSAAAESTTTGPIEQPTAAAEQKVALTPNATDSRAAQ